MAEVKRPREWEMYNGGGRRHSVYLKSDADAYIAALERRLRIAERALEIFDDGVLQCEVGSEESKQRAEREIDSEQKEQEG